MITNCGPLVLRHDAKGPQVVITTGGPSQVLVSILDSGLGFGGCAGAHITIRLESVPETLAPASPPGLPAQLPFRRVVGRASDLGHHRHCDLTHGQPGQPDRQVPRLGCIEDPREVRQPHPHLGGFVVDDVVDTCAPCWIAATVADAASSTWRHRRGRTTRLRCPPRPAGTSRRGSSPRTSPRRLARTASRTAAPRRAAARESPPARGSGSRTASGVARPAVPRPANPARS